VPVVRFLVYGLAKTLSKVFGLATMAFFGRMPTRDDDKMAAVGLLSITWVTVLAAAFVPAIAEFLIPFVPDDEAIQRALAIGLAIAIPLVNGVLVARMHNNREDHGRSTGSLLLHTFWYTPVIGFTVCAVVVTVPLLKASQIFKRFTVTRMLVMIPGGAYDEALQHIVDVLDDRGIESRVEDPSPVLRGMFRVLGYVLGHLFCRAVADQLKIIRGIDADDEPFEINVHAADLSIVGAQKQSKRIHAVLAEGLDERYVYFTWDDDSQALEDRMAALRQQLDDGDDVALEDVHQLREDLATVELDKEEWNNVRRNLYRLERDVYAARAGIGTS
jgi:hypothetical protein